ERALADEFLSGQLLELLTVAEDTCARMAQSEGGNLLGYRAVAQKLRARVAEALKAELAHRESRGELMPDADDPEGLALFLDRAAELPRQWLAGKLSHLYANRVLVLREPSRYEPHRNVVMRGRESLRQARVARPDSLNPGTGAVQRVVTIHYKHRARVTPLKGPTGSVFERLKLVFRYDLEPILSRLDDSVKRV